MPDDELHHELAIFDRPSALHVGDDWMPFPDSFLPDELPTAAANELLTLLDGCPTSPGLRGWLASVRGQANECEAQTSLLGDAA